MLRPTLVLALVALAAPAAAQERTPSHCLALAERMEVPHVQLASYTDPLPDETVRISYIGHASFLIQTTGGLSVITDFTGDTGGADIVPDVVTMNNAHISHFTTQPDARIPNVLEGWAEGGEERGHSVDLGEMLVRNVHTDIRGYGEGDIVTDGNSVFIFEVAGLCIGHLGHLHHIPDAGQYAEIGRLDVVMAAVDGGVSLDTASMTRVMDRFRARLVIPMHWWGRYTLDRFLSEMSDDFDVVEAGIGEITVSTDTLPSRPTVMVLEPRPLE